MERGIDHHDSRAPSRAFTTVNRVARWRDAWTACMYTAENYSAKNIKSFHLVLSQWIPLLNYMFGGPIMLKNYILIFYYCREPNGPKEVFQFYVESTIREKGVRVMHIVFNSKAFETVVENYCSNVSRNNHMLVDDGRGTINFSVMEETVHNPAEFFHYTTTWQMLFLYTLHFMAHWDLFHKSNHANFDTHARLNESEFYNMYYHGQLIV